MHWSAPWSWRPSLVSVKSALVVIRRLPQSAARRPGRSRQRYRRTSCTGRSRWSAQAPRRRRGSPGHVPAASASNAAASLRAIAGSMARASPCLLRYRPGGDGAAAHQGDRPEDAVEGDDALGFAPRIGLRTSIRATAGSKAPEQLSWSRRPAVSRPSLQGRPGRSSRCTSSDAIASTRHAHRAGQAGPTWPGRGLPPARGRRGTPVRARPEPRRDRPAPARRASRERARRRAACRSSARARSARAGRRASGRAAAPGLRAHSAAAKRSPSCARVSGPSFASARSTAATPRSAAAGGTPS